LFLQNLRENRSEFDSRPDPERVSFAIIDIKPRISYLFCKTFGIPGFHKEPAGDIVLCTQFAGDTEMRKIKAVLFVISIGLVNNKIQFGTRKYIPFAGQFEFQVQGHLDEMIVISPGE
jgi:hypothetical protein